MALKGIKVLELSGLAPGPFCGMLLRDFGASVIRIDNVVAGNAFSSADTDCLSNGKRSLAINLKSSSGVQLFKKLTQQSDVLIDPFRQGVMERLKLGPEDLHEINNRLIYARLSGFGHDGPYAKMAGHDINYLGLSGLLSLFGRSNEKPIAPANLAADFGGGGLMCAFGILLALYERDRKPGGSNLGQVIDASMVEGTAYLGSWLFRSQGLPGLWGQPRGQNMLDTGAHFYDTYETRDGKYMCVGALEPKFYAVLLQKLGSDEDEIPQFGDFELSREKLAQKFREKTQEEWVSIFDGSDACVTPMLDIPEVSKHPHNHHRGSFLDPGRVVVPKPAPRLSRTPGVSGVESHGSELPRPGEHSIEILSECGFSEQEIDRFLAEGIVSCPIERSKL